MLRIFVFVFLCLSSLFASEFRLKNQLADAAIGSYIVTHQEKSFTFLYIHDRSDKTITLEEVTIPEGRYRANPLPWKQWFEWGAPGHTSWIVSQVNLQTGQFEETFSYTHNGFIDLSSSNPFLSILLNLPFQEVPIDKRRRIGLPPSYRKVDERPFWNPRLVVDGQTYPGVAFNAWKARWPGDGTELSHKIIEIYVPPAPENAAYPTYFPFWIEVEGKIGSAKIRVVDSGLHACSPKGIFKTL